MKSTKFNSIKSNLIQLAKSLDDSHYGDYSFELNESLVYIADRNYDNLITDDICNGQFDQLTATILAEINEFPTFDEICEVYHKIDWSKVFPLSYDTLEEELFSRFPQLGDHWCTDMERELMRQILQYKHQKYSSTIINNMIAKFNLTTKFNELKINPTQFIIVDGNRKRLMQDEYLCYIVDGDDIVCSAVRCQVYSNEVTYCLWYDGDWISNGPVTDIDITDLEFNDHGKCVSGDGEFQDFIDNYLSKKNLPTTTHSDITPKVGNISEFKT